MSSLILLAILVIVLLSLLFEIRPTSLSFKSFTVEFFTFGKDTLPCFFHTTCVYFGIYASEAKCSDRSFSNERVSMIGHDSVVSGLGWHFSPLDWDYGSQAFSLCSGHWA
jgi:hypothetical protein